MKGPATELIHAGETDLCAAVPLTTPIYATTTFVFDAAEEVLAYNEGRSQKYLYSRYSNPTIVSVEKKLAAIDRAEAALAFSSGMGATATILMALVKAGDEVVCSSAIYGGTLHLLTVCWPTSAFRPDSCRSRNWAVPTACSATHAPVGFESPINPTLRCVDITHAGACRARSALGARQRLQPINQQPLSWCRPDDAERDEILNGTAMSPAERWPVRKTSWNGSARCGGSSGR